MTIELYKHEVYRKLCKDALEIYQGGACNPTPLIRILSELNELLRRSVGTDMKHVAYAPVRLIMAQLGWLAGMGIGTVPDGDAEFVERIAGGVADGEV